MQPTDVNPYSKLAPIYDGMMEQVDYQLWAHYIDELLKRYGRKVEDVCELACGTGSLAIQLSFYGYRMTCSDRSGDMIAVAKSKAQKANRTISFFVEDMCRFISTKSFDAVLCIYDSINYLMEEPQLKSFFANARRLLKSDGLLIFDACTEINSLENFDQRFENDRQYGYVRRSRYIKDQRIQENEIEIRKGDQKFVEIHRQRIYSLDALDSAIRDSSFTKVDCLANFSFESGNESSERVHYILKPVGK